MSPADGLWRFQALPQAPPQAPLQALPQAPLHRTAFAIETQSQDLLPALTHLQLKLNLKTYLEH